MAEAHGICVLHVDDDPALTELTAEMLSEHEAQFTVETATNASEGRDRLATDSFDCIVSDYEMPGQNGIEFLETIREKHPNLPFILYTGKGSEAVASDAIAAGVTDYLQKESGTSQYTVLANKIRNAVERYRQQERAQATRDRLRQIIDLLPQLVFVKDEGGEFLLANEATAEAYGTTVGNLEGATDADFAASEEEVEAFRADDQAVIESGEPKHVPEESLTTEDGETRLLETTKIPYDPVERDGDAVLCISMDITARKERENMLRRYQYAFESALSGIAITDLDGELIDVNSAFLDMWGYDTKEDVTGRPAVDMWKHPEKAQSVLETVTERGRREDELEALRADGSTFYARGVNSYLTDSDGDPIGVISSFFDITDRKEREAELEMQSAAMEASMDGISILNEDGEYVYMNQAHADVFDYDADELLGSTWRRLYDADETARLERDVFPVLEREGEWRGETVGKRGDGTPVHQEITLSLLDDGKLICTNRDVTERTEREQELERTNTVLRTIVETLPMGVLVEDAERDVLMANDQLGDTLGVSMDSEELVGRDCAAAAEELGDLFVDSEGFMRSITKRIERREPVQNEELPLADGRVVERDYMPYTLPEGDAHLWLYRDVTARKQRKQELDRSRQFLRDTQEVANVGGWKLDLQSGSLRWSDEVYRIHGLSPDADVAIEDAIEFYHPDDRDTIRTAVDRLRDEGEPYDLELRIITVGDNVQWVRTFGEPVYENDALIAIQGTFQDITERKEREQKLRRVSERFERFANNVQDAFFILSADYSETEYVNPAVERIYGVTPEEADDNPMAWLRHVHPDDKDELLADVEAQQDGAVEWPVEQEFRIDHPDRGVRWVRARLNTITGENGDPSRLVGVTTDITDRKQREESLNALLEVTRELMNAQSKQAAAEQAIGAAQSVLDQPISGLWLRDSDEEVLQPVAATAKATEVVGAPPTYSAGESLSWEAFAANEFRVYDDVRAHPERFNTETPIRSEIIIPLGEHGVINIGSVEPAEFSEIDVSIARIFGKTVEMALDRADREQRLLNQRSRLQQQNDRLNEFTSVVSHDLRNPLNVATGRLELVTEECDSDHLGSLRRALDRMETLIDDLLALAREGKDVTDAQPVHLATVVNGCWENVETNQASLITDIHGDVCADKSRLKQVLENLFRNAVEHGRADVTVTIGGLDDGFYIEDDGPGIPSDERDAVFKAGYSQSTDGTGFGLSIVEQIVDAHDWQIRITDGADGGARFEITNVEFVTVQGSPSGAGPVEDE
jgi:PAS domain S-box-containing protein